MAGNGNSTVGHWIAIAGVLVAIPGALVAWQALDLGGSRNGVPTGSTSGDDGSSGQASTDQTPSGGDDFQESRVSDDNEPAVFDVSDCVITIEHIAAQLHDEPSHAARVLAAIPDGDYRPSAATEAEWAGRAELWYQLTVDGRTGWFHYSTITVRSVSAGCP